MSAGRYADLVDELGIIGTLHGDELYGPCPLHDDRSPSFAVNVETGLWLCRVNCGEGNLTTLVMRVNGMSRMAALTYIEEYDNPDYIRTYSDEQLKAVVTGGKSRTSRA